MLQESASIAATLAGDATAFRGLVEAYQRRVYNLAYRLLGNGDDAADAAQEAFLRAYAQLRRFDGSRPFGSWLLAITAHHCVDLLRRRRNTAFDLDLAAMHPDPAYGPEDAALVSERRAEVRLMLGQLPPGYRLVVVLRYWYDLPCEEIANTTGLSLSAVKTRLHRARALLLHVVDGGAGQAQPAMPAAAQGSNDDRVYQGEQRALQNSGEVDFAATGSSATARSGARAGRASFGLSLLPALRFGA